jgi:hypothetical protein
MAAPEVPARAPMLQQKPSSRAGARRDARAGGGTIALRRAAELGAARAR